MTLIELHIKRNELRTTKKEADYSKAVGQVF